MFFPTYQELGIVVFINLVHRWGKKKEEAVNHKCAIFLSYIYVYILFFRRKELSTKTCRSSESKLNRNARAKQIVPLSTFRSCNRKKIIITIIHSNKHHDPRKESDNLRMKKRNPGETPSIAISDVPVEETERAQIKKTKKGIVIYRDRILDKPVQRSISISATWSEKFRVLSRYYQSARG